ncbi:hypothetical protein AMR41_14095 [Hapalosiphon sp. MRB220]|nr:hypothetical protein AMR41_14095 [Hapalosiphon sp. MRB220]
MEEQQRQWLIFHLFIWLVVIVLVIRSQWSKKIPSVGLPWMYLLSLCMIHWFGALIYAFPWYETKSAYLISKHASLVNTAIGFEQSTYGVIAFGLGSLIVAPLLLKMLNPPWLYEFPRMPNLNLIKTYIYIGLLFAFVLSPILVRIPSGAALAVPGISLFVVGLCLACWKSWYMGDMQAFIRWLALSCCLPLFTLLFLGFMSFGTAATVVVLLFVFNFYRPRWKLVVIALLVTYLGLSVFVTYFRDRQDIRATSGGDNARIEQMSKTVSNFEFFNLFKQEQLEMIDTRLNQNTFVGVSVQRLSNGLIDYADGATIEQAVLAAVPRVLWPGKTVASGSGDLVSTYTGIDVADGTSMGVGQVLEFYINFSTWGVVLGFLVLGTILRVIDITAGYKLNSGNLVGFVSWFLPGIGLIQPINSLVNIVQTLGGSVVLVYLINGIYLRKAGRRNRANAS